MSKCRKNAEVVQLSRSESNSLNYTPHNQVCVNSTYHSSNNRPLCIFPSAPSCRPVLLSEETPQKSSIGKHMINTTCTQSFIYTKQQWNFGEMLSYMRQLINHCEPLGSICLKKQKHKQKTTLHPVPRKSLLREEDAFH